MHKRKLVRVYTNLEAGREAPGTVTNITPPLLLSPAESESTRSKKLLEPLNTQAVDLAEDAGDGSKSNSPSPRASVIGFEPRPSDAETVLKILVIGDSTVGKTSYVQGFVQNKFLDNYKNTVGVDFSTKLLSHKKYGGRPVKLQIWDIAGQDRYICMSRVYYQNSDGCIIMFDLTNRKSFESVVQWKHDLDSKCILDNGAMLPCLLLASKCDLPDRQVEINEIEAVCHQYNFMSWIEVSSKEHLMIEDSMNFLVDRIICSKRMEEEAVERKSSIRLSEETLRDDQPKKLVPADKVSTYCWC
ncbi:ras-related protein Rab-7L1-like [Diaphorina citri]|uniref:Ras-related protein Rab-7L1-like n=1 Tax=Diaphorina citri TaxID=121845 RepID=A0A3Q0JB19_DIACI|nr:ras-related protein Rab-7L1-like [Diaphorina citri]